MRYRLKIPQILTTEALTEHINKLIVTSVMTPDIGPIIQLNTAEDQSTNTESTAEQEEKTTDSDDPKNDAEIENVKNLLRAINDHQDQNMEEEKNIHIYIQSFPTKAAQNHSEWPILPNLQLFQYFPPEQL